MRIKPRIPLLAALILAGSAVLRPATAGADTIRVFAVASLADAFRQIGAAYERQHPGDRVEFNFASTQVLRTQIEQGAPADAATAPQRVHQIATPIAVNAVDEYPISVVTHSHLGSKAGAFVDVVVSAAGRAILRRFGFQA